MKIDHDSLKYFLEKRLSSEEEQKWVTKILGYDFEIIYKNGKKIVVADTLSKIEEDTDNYDFTVDFYDLVQAQIEKGEH